MSELITSPRPAETPAEVREQIEEHGYANIGVGVNNTDTAELFASFKDFVELTEQPGGEDLKKAVAYKARPESDLLGNESYFIDLRIPGQTNTYEDAARGAGQDHKYVFHIGPQTFARATDRLGKLPAELSTLLQQSSEFYYEGRRAAMLGATALGLKDTLFHKDPTREVHHLRLIDYIASDNQEHAEAHFDRGVVTMAINESHPGLRGRAADNGYLYPLDDQTKADLEEGLLPVAHQENVGKFFTSAGLRRLPEDIRTREALDQLPIFAHDVVNEIPGVNRYAVVQFFNPHLDFPGYNVPAKEECKVSAL